VFPSRIKPMFAIGFKRNWPLHLGEAQRPKSGGGITEQYGEDCRVLRDGHLTPRQPWLACIVPSCVFENVVPMSASAQLKFSAASVSPATRAMREGALQFASAVLYRAPYPLPSTLWPAWCAAMCFNVGNFRAKA
jgi:hypothetical protein